MAAIAISISAFRRNRKSRRRQHAGAGLGITTLLVALLAVAARYRIFVFGGKAKTRRANLNTTYKPGPKLFRVRAIMMKALTRTKELAWLKKASGLDAKKAKEKLELPGCSASATGFRPQRCQPQLKTTATDTKSISGKDEENAVWPIADKLIPSANWQPRETRTAAVFGRPVITECDRSNERGVRRRRGGSEIWH